MEDQVAETIASFPDWITQTDQNAKVEMLRNG